MKIVYCMGYVYKLTEKNYRALLTTAAAGDSWDLDKFGTQLYAVDLRSDDIEDPDAAKEVLDSLKT